MFIVFIRACKLSFHHLQAISVIFSFLHVCHFCQELNYKQVNVFLINLSVKYHKSIVEEFFLYTYLQQTWLSSLRHRELDKRRVSTLCDINASTSRLEAPLVLFALCTNMREANLFLSRKLFNKVSYDCIKMRYLRLQTFKI